MSCSNSEKCLSLLMNSALNQGASWGTEGGLAFRHSQHNPDGDPDEVPHRCQLWALLYNSAESGVILPALPSSILKEEGEAETHPGLPQSPQAGPPSQAPHQVNGTIRPCQV